MSTAMIYEIVSTSSDDTERLGELLGQIIKAPAVIELRSDLGGGKTTLARGFAKGFGVKEPITSPTFSIYKIYPGQDGHQLDHYDFYRLSESGVLADQLSESLQNTKAVTLVEWADLVKNVLPEDHLTIVIKPVQSGSDHRIIEIHYPEDQFEIIKKLETQWQGIRP